MNRPMAARQMRQPRRIRSLSWLAGFDAAAPGLVAGLNGPGGNVTGMSVLDAAVDPKWLELLHDRYVIAAYKASPFITFFGPIGAYLFLNT